MGTISPSMWLKPLSGSGTVLVERYRLEERLSGPDPLRGSLWRAVDVMAGDLPVAMRQLDSGIPGAIAGGVATDADAVAFPVAPLRRAAGTGWGVMACA